MQNNRNIYIRDVGADDISYKIMASKKITFHFFLPFPSPYEIPFDHKFYIDVNMHNRK